MKSVAIFGASKVGQTPWRPGKKVLSIAIFGASEIDFRQAELEEGTTEVVAFSMFGANMIVVPPDIPVILSGFSLFGARELKRSQAKEAPPTSGKALHINAVSIFGACAVTDQSGDN